MAKQKFFDELFDELGQKIQETVGDSPVKDLEKNVKSLMGSAFNKMDLVTREEFDVQQQVLLKTREQLAILEQQIATLEKKLSGSGCCSKDSSGQDTDKAEVSV